MKKLLKLGVVGTALYLLWQRRGSLLGLLRGGRGEHQPSFRGPSSEETAGATGDDATLARKVETEIFRDADAPKGTVDVNAELGVVYLRGEVESRELMDDLVARAQAVQGVNRVESLLHLPGEPAPMKE